MKLTELPKYIQMSCDLIYFLCHVVLNPEFINRLFFIRNYIIMILYKKSVTGKLKVKQQNYLYYNETLLSFINSLECILQKERAKQKTKNRVRQTVCSTVNTKYYFGLRK